MRFGDTRIAFGDVDGLFVVERKGRFLFMETKTGSEPLWDGQALMLGRLSHVPGFTVIVVRGPKGEPATVARIAAGIEYPEEPTSRADMQRRVDDWFVAANAANPLNRLDVA